MSSRWSLWVLIVQGCFINTSGEAHPGEAHPGAARGEELRRRRRSDRERANTCLAAWANHLHWNGFWRPDEAKTRLHDGVAEETDGAEEAETDGAEKKNGS